MSIKLQNFSNLDNINNDIYNRNIPSTSIQLNFSPRPSMSKYSIMPIIEEKKVGNVEITNGRYFNNNIFYPGTRKLDFCGFARKIDDESTLRNQFFALQKSDHSKWVPSSSSDLYKSDIIPKNDDIINNSLLFKENTFNNHNPNISSKIGQNYFNNSTRVQLKNL